MAKTAAGSRTTAKALLLFGIALPSGFALPAAAQVALPEGAAVTSGAASFSASDNTLTVSQTSSNAIVSWNSFSIGQGGTVQFNNGTGATLNRVTGTSLSSIDGLLGATGSVYLINPNGVVIGKSGVVETGGSFIASTLDLADQDFLHGGDTAFSGLSTASVVNLGKIGSLGGDVALIAARVENDGTLTAANGTAGMLAGSSVLLRDASIGNGRFYVQSGGAGTQVTNTGGIEAAAIELKANNGSVLALAGNTGSYIKATGTGERDGRVWLLAGSDGTTVVSGTALSATNGNFGGFIETSGGTVNIADDASISTVSASGQFGTWLIDPNDYTIGAGGNMTGAALSTALGSGNVTIQSVSGTAGGNGDIFVNDAVTWSTGSTLTLQAYRDININRDITVSGAGGVSLITGDQDMNGTGDAALGDYNFGLGSSGFGGSLTYTGSGGSLSINGDAYTLLYSLAELEGIDNTAGNYALARDLTASGTRTTALIGALDGALTGLGHTITDLTIDATPTTLAAPPNDPVGLIGEVRPFAVVRDIGVTGGSVQGEAFVGGLVGFNFGTIHQSYATNTVNGLARDGASMSDPPNYLAEDSFNIGGLAGYSEGTISRSFATGAVTGGFGVGGLVGAGFDPRISQSYATGAVTGESTVGGLIGSAVGASALISQSYATGAVSGDLFEIGGLVGILIDGTIDQTYATGMVTGDAGATDIGGLVGLNDSGGGTVTNSNWDTQTSGQSTSDGGTGQTTAQLQGTLPTGFDSDVWSTGAGLYPYLDAFGLVAAGQGVSGFVFNADGTAATSGAAINLYTGGSLLGSSSSGANGYYYYLNQGGAITGTTMIGGTLRLSGASGVSGVNFTDRPNIAAGDVTNFNITSDTFAASTARTAYSALLGDLSGTFGSGSLANPEQFGGSAVNIFAANAFTIDRGLAGNFSILIEAQNGDLTISPTGSVESVQFGNPITLAANGAFINNRGQPAVSTIRGHWRIYSTTPANSTADVRGGLSGTSYYGSTYTFGNGGFSAPVGAGNRFVHGYQPTLTVNPVTQSLTYTGAVQTNTYGVAGYLAADAGADSLAGTVTGLTTPSRNVGAYAMTAAGTLASDMNYAINYGTGTLTITPAPLTLSAVSDTRVYNGTTSSSGTVNISGLLGSDTATATQAFGSRNVLGPNGSTLSVGPYTVNDGNGGANYSVTASTATGTITPAPLTLSAVSDTRVYNGTTSSSGAVNISGLLGSDTATATQAFGSRNVLGLNGSTLSVGPYTVNDGNGGANYSVTASTATGTVTPAPLTLAAVTDTRVYNGTTSSSGTVNISGLLGSDTATATQAFGSRNVLGSNGSTLSVGPYTVNDGNGGANYSVTTSTATGTITPAPLTLSAVTDTRNVNGTTTSSGVVATSGLFAGDTVTGATQSFNSPNVGSRTLSVNPGYAVNDGNGGQNYTATATSATGTIFEYVLSFDPSVRINHYTDKYRGNFTDFVGSYVRGLEGNYVTLTGGKGLVKITVTAPNGEKKTLRLFEVRAYLKGQGLSDEDVDRYLQALHPWAKENENETNRKIVLFDSLL